MSRKSAPVRVALYLRVSTSGQTVENQRLELERVAGARGWAITATYHDKGICGAKGRDVRPGFDGALKGAMCGEYDVLMAWDVSRLAHSLADLATALKELHAAGRGLYLHVQGMDTTTSSGRAMFQMCGVFAEFEREMIRERVNAGIAWAKVAGTKSGRRIGRPALPAATANAIRARRAGGESIRAIAKGLQVSTTTVQKVLSAA
jgi:DNA invertase Pin-like site-specific DNA recombinase